MMVSTLLRRAVKIVAATAIFVSPSIAFTQCVGISEEGLWRNVNNNGEPSYIYVKTLGGCPDNNGETGGPRRYKMRVWVRQAPHQYYKRPYVDAAFRPWNRKRWLQGNVPTGGYQDQMWLLVEERDGRSQLHVYIKHKSLDSKPSTQSEY